MSSRVERVSRFGRLLFDHVRRHLVQVCLVSVLDGVDLNHKKAEAHFLTTFLVRRNGKFFLATCGHVIHDMKKRESTRKYCGCVFVPMASGNGGGKVQSQKVSAWGDYDEKLGRDIGYFAISNSEAEELVALGAKPLPEVAMSPPAFEPDIYLSIGFPHELRTGVSQAEPDLVKGQFDLALLGLRLEPVQDEYDRTGEKVPRFKGRVVSKVAADQSGTETVVHSHNGASGGPIVVAQLHERGYVFSVLAIQTREAIEDQIVTGNYCAALWERIDQAFPPENPKTSSPGGVGATGGIDSPSPI